MKGTGTGFRPVLLAFIAILAFSVLSCKKNQQADLSPNLNVANDIIIGERPVIYAFTMLVRAASDTSLQQTHQAVIDHASVVYNPGQMRYTFYYFGAACADGVIRSGRFDGSLTGGLFTVGTSGNIVFTGYFEDYMPVSGSDSLVCTGHEFGNAHFTNHAVLKIVKDSAGSIFPDITLNYETPLYNPYGINDSQVLIAGSDSGTSSKGISYVSVITDTLRLRMNCGWISEGTIDFTAKGAEKPSGKITFISGTGCSNRVDYDFSGTVYHWKMQLYYLLH